MTQEERKQKAKALIDDILFVWAAQGKKPPTDENGNPMKWKCRRCETNVNMEKFRCQCTERPSLWEPIR